MDRKKNDPIDIIGANKTEAWTNVDHYQDDTCVSIPSTEAVEEAKEWVEENEK